MKCGKDQTFNGVLADTGSAILWLGGEDPYVQDSNTKASVCFTMCLHPNSYSTLVQYQFNFQCGILTATGVQGIAYRDTVIDDATGYNQ